MIIVYLSIALIIGSLGYLGYTAFKIFKKSKPSLKVLNELSTRMQVKADTIKTETDKLTQNQQQLITDISQKKRAINTTVTAAKQTPVMFKQLVKAKPVTKLEHKRKARMWNMARQNRLT
ncbi:DUF948 domain-containing protein [Mesobacillus zeae]|uniref:DUF948 domain-containing protein n=1 Tax=Mesobacillus zeae TaxID=1917180 RepID=A0A398B9M8_9BACI|nr:DUF948 domain-containing protein [Mesobacillus zeae]RID84416.1 DUF948 domain-containing protein [Mesobacillus zeae]